jgi:hypothetical protein
MLSACGICGKNSAILCGECCKEHVCNQSVLQAKHDELVELVVWYMEVLSFLTLEKLRTGHRTSAQSRIMSSRIIELTLSCQQAIDALRKAVEGD